ncbi:hypothetical protein ACTXT7_014543 [Hymenolepis weldensis]
MEQESESEPAEVELVDIIYDACQSGPFYKYTTFFSTYNPEEDSGKPLYLPLCVVGPMMVLREFLHEDLDVQRTTFIDKIDTADLELTEEVIEDIKWIVLECKEYEEMESYFYDTSSIYVFTILCNILKFAMYDSIEFSPFFLELNMQHNFFMDKKETISDDEEQVRISKFRLFEKMLRFFYKMETGERSDVYLHIFNYVMHEFVLIIRDYIYKFYHIAGSLCESRYFYDMNNKYPVEINKIFTSLASVLAVTMMDLPADSEGEHEQEQGQEQEEEEDDSKPILNSFVGKSMHCFKNILFINDIELFDINQKPMIPQIVLWDPYFKVYVKKMKKLENEWEQKRILREMFRQPGNSTK